jgi:hypothetical protein
LINENIERFGVSFSSSVDEVMVISSIESQGDLEIVSPRFEICRVNSDRMTSSLCRLAIGSRSQLLQEYGSTDFVRFENNNTGIVRLNSTRESFVSDSCVPDSILEVLYSTEPTRVGHEMSTDVHADTFIGPNFSLFMRFAPNAYVIGLPNLMFHHIVELTGQEVPMMMDNFIRFPRCNETFPLLPPIKMRFPLSGGDTITITPGDYVRRIDDDVCELLLAQNTWRREFNPFQLSGLNVRFENDRVLFCDTPF